MTAIGVILILSLDTPLVSFLPLLVTPIAAVPDRLLVSVSQDTSNGATRTVYMNNTIVAIIYTNMCSLGTTV